MCVVCFIVCPPSTGTRMGENCWVPGCGMNRKTKGLYFHKFPITKHPGDIQWRENLDKLVRKYRDPKVDPRNLEKRLADGKIFTCERHYRPEDFEFTPTGKKKVKLYVMPTLNLPVKSHETAPPPERNPPRHREPLPQKSDTLCYKDRDDLVKRLGKLKISPWTFRLRENGVYIELLEATHILPKIQIRVNEVLDISIFVYNWSLPKDHEIYQHHTTLHNIFLSDLLKLITPYNICNGVGTSVEPSKIHSVPLEVTEPVSPENSSIETRRSLGCLLLSADEICGNCSKCEKHFLSKLEKNNAYNQIPAKPQAPHSTTNPQKLILGLKQRLEAEKRENKRLQRESIEKHGISKSQVGSGLESFITKTMTENTEKMTPFVKLFWEEQTKYNSMNSVRYHPMIIRFALSLAMKSLVAYEELRNSGIMVLPCQRTLRDYKNAITPSTGFNPGVIAGLKKMCKDFNELEKLVVLSFDEVKIQSNLIFDKHSGKIIGFVDFGDEDINTGTISDANNVATHVMSFHLRTFLGHIKFNLGFFATEGALSFQIYPLFWKAVGLLEMACNLKVIGAVCDGASPNRKFIKMHSKIDGRGKADVTYRTINLYDRSRFIWFFSDYPHLMKTSRNCLLSSGFGDSFSRQMWNNGKYLVWRHIRDILSLNTKGPKVVPKMTEEHVNLSSHSKMKVYLAVQVLSGTNAKFLLSKFGPEHHGTAKFCSMMNRFFDIMNVRHMTEYMEKRNWDIRPFESPDDDRLQWLKNEFLQYFIDWEKSIEDRTGFEEKEKEKMFISRQTMEGIKITVHSVIECVKFLLNSGMKYVLTEKFTQDLLELYFGLQRACGASNDNPTVQQFGWNDNAIRARGQLAKVRVEGNTKGGQKKHKHSWYAVNDEPLPKKCKQARK